jgi:hypothetical protein
VQFSHYGVRLGEAGGFRSSLISTSSVIFLSVRSVPVIMRQNCRRLILLTRLIATPRRLQLLTSRSQRLRSIRVRRVHRWRCGKCPSTSAESYRKIRNRALRQVIHFAGVRHFGEAQPGATCFRYGSLHEFTKYCPKIQCP